MLSNSKRRILVTMALVMFGGLWGLYPSPADPPRGASASEPARREEPSGYGAAFDAEVKKIGQISPQEFSKRYQLKVNYQDQLSWDPTTAKFFDKVMLDPGHPDARVRAREPGAKAMAQAQGSNKDKEGMPVISAKGMYDFRLNDAEL